MAECIRDDSTDCSCPRCTAAEDAFWREQGDGQRDPYGFDVGDLDDSDSEHVHLGYTGSLAAIDENDDEPPTPEDDLSW